MPENKTGIDLHWLESMFGVKPQSLPAEAIAVANELGPNGVRELVEQHKSSTVYRGGLISQEERISLAETIHRLALEGGGSWAEREPVVGDSPNTWIEEEVNELLGENR